MVDTAVSGSVVLCGKHGWSVFLRFISSIQFLHTVVQWDRHWLGTTFYLGNKLTNWAKVNENAYYTKGTFCPICTAFLFVWPDFVHFVQNKCPQSAQSSEVDCFVHFFKIVKSNFFPVQTPLPQSRVSIPCFFVQNIFESLALRWLKKTILARNIRIFFGWRKLTLPQIIFANELQRKLKLENWKPKNLSFGLRFLGSEHWI